MQNNFKKIMLIISLLALNVVEQAASVVNSTIPGMAKSFPNESLVHIELVTTVVSIFVTVFVLVSGIVVKRLGQKNTAVIGLAIATVSSIIPAFANNFWLIFASRAVLGIGIGLANPLAISLIGTFFHGDERAKLLGWRSAIAGVGTSLMTYFAGQLLSINWHAAYWVYLLFVPTLIFFIIFVPNPEKEGLINYEEESSVASEEINDSNKKDSPVLVAILAILTFIFLTAGMVFAVKLPTYFVDFKVGTPTQASNAWSIHSIANLIGGAAFGYIYKRINKYILPLGLLLDGAGIVVASFTKSVIGMYIICIVTGAFAAMVIPYIFNKISETSSASKAPLYTSIVLVGSNLGSFLSPYTGKLIGSTSAGSILNAGIILVVLAAVVFVWFILKLNPSKK